jgi:hypothetical protein
LDFLAMPISSLSHCRMLLAPTLYVISQRVQWAIPHHKRKMLAPYTGW